MLGESRQQLADELESRRALGEIANKLQLAGTIQTEDARLLLQQPDQIARIDVVAFAKLDKAPLIMPFDASDTQRRRLLTQRGTL